MKITVVDLGYVGTAAGLSEAGHQIVGIDIDHHRAEELAARRDALSLDLVRPLRRPQRPPGLHPRVPRLRVRRGRPLIRFLHIPVGAGL